MEKTWLDLPLLLLKIWFPTQGPQMFWNCRFQNLCLSQPWVKAYGSYSPRTPGDPRWGIMDIWRRTMNAIITVYDPRHFLQEKKERQRERERERERDKELKCDSLPLSHGQQSLSCSPEFQRPGVAWKQLGLGSPGQAGAPRWPGSGSSPAFLPPTRKRG